MVENRWVSIVSCFVAVKRPQVTAHKAIVVSAEAKGTKTTDKDSCALLNGLHRGVECRMPWPVHPSLMKPKEWYTNSSSRNFICV